MNLMFSYSVNSIYGKFNRSHLVVLYQYSTLIIRQLTQQIS